MTKPTTGPWEVKHSQSKDAWNIVGNWPGCLYKIARLPYHQDKRMSVEWNEAQKAEQLANANLMAAAPDLLEELEWLLDKATSAGWPSDLLEPAQQAIKKAKGL